VDMQGQRAVLLAMAALSVLGPGRTAQPAASLVVVVQGVVLCPTWVAVRENTSRRPRTSTLDVVETSMW